jgi:hypothetical protein
MLDGVRPNTLPPSFLSDLSVDKSGHCPDGRACHPAAPRARRSSRKSSTGRFLIAHHPLGRRVPRPPRQSRPDYRCLEGGFPALRLRAVRSGLTICHWQIVRAALTPLPVGLCPSAIGPQKRSTGAFPVGPLRAQCLQCRHWRSPESCPLIAPCPHR